MTRFVHFTVKLDNPPAGFSLASVQTGNDVPILGKGFFTSDDGPLLYTYLDSFFGSEIGAGLVRACIRPEDVNTALVNVVDGTTAKVWINFPTKLTVVPKRPIQGGDVVMLNDIADVRDLTLVGIELPTFGALAYTFQAGWRRGFYFDFSMNHPPAEPNRPLENVAALLGSLHAALLLRERIQMAPGVLEKMFASGWFPFARLPHDLVVALYRDFQEGWDHRTTEEEIVRAVSPEVPAFLKSWTNKPAFAPHIDALSVAVEHFAKGEFLAASSIALPKVEGLLRTISTGRGRASARDLRRNLVARVRAVVGGATALLPEAFVEFLEDYYYAGFDLDTNHISPSRNSFMHGVGPDAEAAKPAYALRLLLTIDQLFFYV